MSRRRRGEPAAETKTELKEEIKEEAFEFSFSEEPLTPTQCAEKFSNISSKEQFYELIPAKDAVKFLNKAFLGRKGELMQCFQCEKVYTSGSGFTGHLAKCGTVPSDIKTQYRERPSLWLKVDKSSQKTILEQIVVGDYRCFGIGCTKKCSTAKALIDHLAGCIKPAFHTYADRPEEFRKLDTKTKNSYAREALSASLNGVGCLFCGRVYEHQHSLIYHIDRCQLDKSEQPWKCYRCGFEAKADQSGEHLEQCARQAEEKKWSEMMKNMQGDPYFDDGPTSAKRRSGIRATPRKDGSMLYRYRKSTVNRESTAIVTGADQRRYEKACSTAYADWKDSSAEAPFCERLAQVEKSTWKTTALHSSDPLYQIFHRQSVTIVPGNVEGLQRVVPPGIRVNARDSALIETEDTKMTAAFCGAPINSVKVAPGKMENGDDVICVTTFANETDFESDSSVVQFWRHRVAARKSSELEMWFLLHLPNKGTILSMTWLQKHEIKDESLIGFAAFSTTIGEVLIYRIDSSSAVVEGSDVQVVVAEPHITLTMPKKSKNVGDQDQSNEDTKVNGDDTKVNEDGAKVNGDDAKVNGDDAKGNGDDEENVPTVTIDESTVPIIKITWAAQTGGRHLVGVTALGSLAVWDLNESTDKPTIKIDDEWQSPPSDVAFVDDQHIVVGFREKIVKVYDIHNWDVKLEENTMKTAGSRVHTDSRIVHSFFTFQSEYMSLPYPNSTSVAFIDMAVDSQLLVLVPTANTHQLMVWDVAMCPPTGTLVSCGVDGRLIASASGRLLKHGNFQFFANCNVLTLKRRKVENEVLSLPEILKTVKTESKPMTSDKEKKDPLEESVVLHNDVCKKMWLEVAFDESFEGGRPELACRDQRIESLNCVDTNADGKWPVSFTGGEAGLLFAVPSQLTIED